MTLFIFIAIISLFTLMLAIACLRLYKLHQYQAKNIMGLQNQLSALCAGAVGSDERSVKFSQALHHLKEQQNTMSLGTDSHHNYDHAIRLARKGADIEQLIDNCNLSDEEAHLINRLHSEEQLEKVAGFH